MIFISLTLLVIYCVRYMLAVDAMMEAMALL